MAEEPAKTREELPRIPMGPNSLAVISHCLYLYVQVVKREQSPSVERRLHLSAIEHLRKRIAKVLASGFPEGEGLFLSDRECEMVERALSCFIAKLPLMVPQSRHRDETIEAVKQLHRHFSQILSSDHEN